MAALWLTVPVFADTLVVSQNGPDVTLSGEFLYEALDKSILFETTDGQLHIFEAEEIVSVDKQDEELPVMKHEELAASLLADLPNPEGFKTLVYKLSPSKFPLAIIVFDTRPQYDAYAYRELGVEPGTMIAHYSQLTNRVAMYDLTFDLGKPQNGAGKKRKLEEVCGSTRGLPTGSRLRT